MFTSIPFGFLFRDDWGESENSEFEDVHSKFHRMEYIKKVLKVPLHIYTELEQILAKNTNKTKRRTDYEAVIEYNTFVERYSALYYSIICHIHLLLQ